MNIEYYKIDKSDKLEPKGARDLVRKIKWDFVILFPLTFALIIASNITGNRLVDRASLVSFALIFVVFFVRICMFAKNSADINICPYCHSKLETCRDKGLVEIVCHTCQIIFKKYKRSDKPDGLYEEIDAK